MLIGKVFDDIDSLPFASLIRFYDKILFWQIRKIELIEFFAIGDDAVCLSKRYASFYEKILRLKLVVRETDTFLVIELFDVEEIPGVVAENTEI